MKRIHIIGRKNSGKTTLIVELVRVLTARGLRVGTIKHTHHRHQLDTPGKDSFRHGEAGAKVVGILTPGVDAVFRSSAIVDADADRYERLTTMFVDCDIVLVEGDSQTDAPKIEVWRSEVDEPPLGAADPRVLAVVSEDEVPVKCQTWPRTDVGAVAAHICASLKISAHN
ncbi:MAG: molybdopterin-guanine dinucleotide biosynthesis protein B [Pirellulales bacterium]|nr:molybdopterin-guanine dinucleotide biosynthesis protein B [Pirellulales bacterium]